MKLVQKLWAKKEAFLANEDGATAIEYGLIAAGIAIAIIATVFLLGDELDNTFNTVLDSLSGANSSGSGT